jgi:hypothetical protein
VNIGNNAVVTSTGAMHFAVDGAANMYLQVNTDTYGAVTAAYSTSYVDVRPDNEIIVGNNATITAGSDTVFMAGEDSNLNNDSYSVEAHTDAFAGSAIPISEIDAHAFVVQTNKITIESGANVSTAGNALFYANSIGEAHAFAKGKATSWASSAADAILSLTGGDPQDSFDGDAFSVSHGIVENDGSIHTGMNRDITFSVSNYNGGALAAGHTLATASVTGGTVQLDVYNPENLTYTFSEKTVSSSLIDTLNSAQDELNQYQALLASAPSDPSLQAQVTFDQTEVSRIESQLAAEGLGTYQDVSVNGQVQHLFIVTQKVELVVDIAAFTAQAGQIKVFADQMQGTGVFDAPSDVAVNITDTSSASLEVQGITIPQLTGGTYFNGHPVASNSAVSAMNVTNANVDNEVPLSSTSPAVAGNAAFSQFIGDATQATPVINITSTYGGGTGPDGAALPGADVFISGAVNAVEATLTIVSAGDIDITADVTVNTQHYTATHNVVIDQYIATVAGNPAAGLINASPTSAQGVDPLSGTAVSNYENSQPSAADQVIKGQTITINAQYLDLNGLIQAGEAAPTLTLNPNTVGANGMTMQQEINSDLAQHMSGQIKLYSVSNDQFTVYYDTTQSRLVVDTQRVTGGLVTIQAQIYNTAQGEIKALAGYGTVNITNNSNYDMVVDAIDASAHGTGIIKITDLNMVDAANSAYYLQTTYLANAAGCRSRRPSTTRLTIRSLPTAPRRSPRTAGATRPRRRHRIRGLPHTIRSTAHASISRWRKAISRPSTRPITQATGAGSSISARATGRANSRSSSPPTRRSSLQALTIQSTPRTKVRPTFIQARTTRRRTTSTTARTTGRPAPGTARTHITRSKRR